MARDHRKLQAFALADALAMTVYQATQIFEPTETYGLRAQIRRASVSIATNIVEGAARDGHGDYLRFLEIAFSSSRELNYLVDLSTRLGFLEPPAGARVAELGNQVAATLGALRASLKRP